MYAIVFWWLVFTIIVTAIGANRKIGATTTFFLCLFLSPIVGIIAVLDSKKLPPEMPQLPIQPVKTDFTEQLKRLNELRKEGALTEEEFELQKQKLLQ